MVVNDSDVTYEYVALRVQAVDEEGNEINSFLREKTDLQGGEVWDFEVDAVEEGWSMEYNEEDDRWELFGGKHRADYEVEIQTEPF